VVTDSIKSRLARGDRVVVFSIGRMFHPNVIRYLGMQGGWDGFWVDLEHSALSAADVEVAVATGAGHGLDSFVRVAPTDYATVTRCFESGASGVLAAQIRSAEHAEEFVTWAKFAPRGRRGLNPLGYDGGYGSIPMAQFAEKANRETLVGVQIETAGAVSDIEAIAAIDGIDLLFVGPSDLSQALGVTGDIMNPACLEAVERIGAACRAHGKSWGAVTPTPEYAEMLSAWGCTMLSITNDVKLMAAGLDEVKSRFAAMW